MHGYYLSFWNDTDIVWHKNITMFKYQSFVTRILQLSLQLNNLSNCKICPQETQIFFGGIYLHKSPYNYCAIHVSVTCLITLFFQVSIKKRAKNTIQTKQHKWKSISSLCLLTNVKLWIKSVIFQKKDWLILNLDRNCFISYVSLNCSARQLICILCVEDQYSSFIHTHKKITSY